VNHFAGDHSEDEKWLQDHKKSFRNPQEFQKPAGPDWKAPRGLPRKRRGPKKSPIRIGDTKQMCPHCKQPAPAETFRDTKCLSCQVSEFLGPTP
jgi:hypothetical protein